MLTKKLLCTNLSVGEVCHNRNRQSVAGGMVDARRAKPPEHGEVERRESICRLVCVPIQLDVRRMGYNLIRPASPLCLADVEEVVEQAVARGVRAIVPRLRREVPRRLAHTQHVINRRLCKRWATHVSSVNACLGPALMKLTCCSHLLVHMLFALARE